jgi:hypothetical protein
MQGSFAHNYWDLFPSTTSPGIFSLFLLSAYSRSDRARTFPHILDDIHARFFIYQIVLTGSLFTTKKVPSTNLMSFCRDLKPGSTTLHGQHSQSDIISQLRQRHRNPGLKWQPSNVHLVSLPFCNCLLTTRFKLPYRRRICLLSGSSIITSRVSLAANACPSSDPSDKSSQLFIISTTLTDSSLILPIRYNLSTS